MLRQREPRVVDKAFLAFVRTKPCCSCGQFPPAVQAAHIRMACPELDKRAVGLGEKPDDRWAVPLCVAEHLDNPNAQHKGSERAFWKRVGVDPFAVAMALYAEFRPDGPPSDSGPKVRRRKRKRLNITTKRFGRVRVGEQHSWGDGRSTGSFIFTGNKLKPKMKWPKQRLRSASRWPQGRKIRSKQ
jgi:hypothetical protein